MDFFEKSAPRETIGPNFMSTWTNAEYKKMLGIRAPTNVTEIEPTILDTSIKAFIKIEKLHLTNPPTFSISSISPSFYSRALSFGAFSWRTSPHARFSLSLLGAQYLRPVTFQRPETSGQSGIKWIFL